MPVCGDLYDGIGQRMRKHHTAVSLRLLKMLLNSIHAYRLSASPDTPYILPVPGKQFDVAFVMQHGMIILEDSEYIFDCRPVLCDLY